MSPARGSWRKTLFQLWRLNFRLGWPERARGLHYWLGFEYALILNQMMLEPGSRVLDVGSGAYSVFPYLAAHLFDVQMTAIDITSRIQRQADIRKRAVRARLCRPDQVQLLQADARSLPFLPDSFDAVSIISVLEHFPNRKDAGQALAEAARVLRPEGKAWLTLPYRHSRTIPETDKDRVFFQWHFSPESLANFILNPSGLVEMERIYYGERWPFYKLTRSLPAPLNGLNRPLDTICSAALLRPVPEPSRASAVLVKLVKS